MAFTFISGATGGIGKAFARASAKKGYDLFLTGRSADKLLSLKEELQGEFGVTAEFYPCQLNDENSRAEMFGYIAKRDLRFDRIINVAGVDTQKAFCDYTAEKLLFQIRVNCEGALAVTHALLPRLIDGGEIITIGSMSGVSPMPYFAVYSASKEFLLNFFTALRYELKDRKIKITTVLPGGVPTREDVKRAIELQGLWGKLSAKPAEFVAERSLKAVRKNKIKYIPGFFNKFLYFMMKIAPKRLVLRVIAKRWKTQSKDAF